MAAPTALNARRRPRQQRSHETVEAILQAAAHVFERHGYAAGTTNRIAARAGVSIGSLYQFFPNKDSIAVELARRHLAEMEAIAWPALQQLVERVPPLHDGLTAIVYGMITLHRQSPQLHRVLFEEVPRTPEIVALQGAVFDRASSLIGDYLRSSPQATSSDPYVAGRMVAQVVDRVTHGVVIHPVEDDDPDLYARETITMLERYLVG